MVRKIRLPKPVDADDYYVGKGLPSTSHQMMRDALPSVGTRRRMVWDFIDSRGRYGATAEEVGLHFGWAHQTYSSAVSTLKRDGHLLRSGRKRATTAGNEADVMVTPQHYSRPKLRRVKKVYRSHHGEETSWALGPSLASTPRRAR